ncbi:MAG: BrnA antitoxin family protein [Alphaproteobacteria bacterium]|nr:BrnA antitoxin family protein [Alphaproteobacteria bacterium]
MSGNSIARPSRRRAKRTRAETKRLRRVSDAAIRRAAAADPDTFMPGAEWFARARIVMPEPKKLVTLRLDADVLDWFRHRGRGYQTRINAVLRGFVAAQRRAR